MKYSIRTSLIFSVALVCLALSLPAFAGQSDALPKGTIIDRVVCRDNASQSYALFLPTSYTPQKRWPIIYCFDPAARGRAPLERFKDAAEKYGVIIACSNNSRNGSNDVATAANAVKNDTSDRLSIDDRLVYTAGFSGGGRIANAIALAAKDTIAGVIACGGGFPNSNPPTKAITYALFATAGTEDFNYPEMRELTRSFERLGLATRFATFEGGHDWLTPELADEALAWMQLQAMKTNRRPRDEAFITEFLNQNLARTRADEAAGKRYDAYLRLAATARDFKGLRDTAELEKHVAELQDAKDIKQALKQEDDQEREQQKQVKELFRLMGASKQPGERQQIGPDNMPKPGEQSLKDDDERQQADADLLKHVTALKKKLQAQPGDPDRRVARRSLNQFLGYLSEDAQMQTARKQYAAAADELLLVARILPDNPRALYNLACAYAMNHDRRRALEALRQAVDKGFKDTTALETDKELESVRDDAAYKQIVTELKKGS